jgi:predicted CXXCH cytochrome family protein
MMGIMRRAVLPPVVLLLIGVLALGAKSGGRGRHLLQPQRNLNDITRILAESGHQGDCDQCHTLHGKGPVAYGHALLGPDENSLCDNCHATPWSGGSYAGPQLYTGSAHAAGSATIWPGPDPAPRTEPNAAGKCLNCHDAHGLVDATGLIPALGLGREQALCLGCHDGSPATTNIGADFAKAFRHPIVYDDRHRGPAETDPADFAVVPQNKRHAECVDCHNPHLGTRDPEGPPPAPAMSRSLLGVSRVLVQNGAAGTKPIYTFLPASDTLTVPRTEYQICFKCHSSWTTQPTGQPDLAIELNPANASYHPVEAAGTDPTIAPSAFAPGWSASSLTGCGDCHGSDVGGARRGPHGSTYRHILKSPYEASSQARVMSQDESCFSCHAYQVYADSSSADLVRTASRFNQPGAAQGHAEHVGLAVPCYACHVTHGAASQRHLIAVGRMPGIISYSEGPTGGTCLPTCHSQQTYSTNYGR